MAVENWLAPLFTGVVSLLAGGGGVAWYSAWADKKRGIRETDLAQETAETDYWKNIIEMQTRALLDPLTARVASLGVEVAELEQKVDKLQKDNRALERRDALWERYAEDLVEHINDRKGPPAPGRPIGL